MHCRDRKNASGKTYERWEKEHHCIPGDTQWQKNLESRTLFRVKISLHWLQDFVRFQSSDAHHIAERLTESVAEVERVEELGLTDVIFHIDNHAITHRPDLFSHNGFARECVSIGLAKWKKLKNKNGKLVRFPSSPLPFRITVQDKFLIPRYYACTIHIDSPGETPLWMRQRLHSIGCRSVSLPVDITNYIAAEIGVPLHSFDCANLSGDITIRPSKRGEHIVTLDGIDRELPDSAIVMSDTQGIFDLLGIMGGLRSSTKRTTHDILLHAATANPIAIRRTILATGHRTEAATVYEKGIPSVLVCKGFLRAVDLFLALVPGARITSKKVSFVTDGEPSHLLLSLDRASRTIGMDIPKSKAISILENLGCDVKSSKLKAQSSKLIVTPPLYRLLDLRKEHDLIEELARVYGYDRLHAVMPSAPCHHPHRDQRLHQIRTQAKEEGFLEVLPLSLVGPPLLRRSGLSKTKCIAVENTLGEELSLLQPSALPRLLEHAEKAFRQAGTSLYTFTITHVFSQPNEESQTLTLLFIQKNAPLLRSSPPLLLKSHITAILQNAGYSPAFSSRSSSSPLAHPAQYAELFYHDQTIGEIFTVHPDVCAAFDLPASTAAASVNLDVLFALPVAPRPFRALPAFPSVSYDIPLPHARSAVPLRHLLEKARKVSPLLTDISVADLFDGKPLMKGEYNVTLRCVYQDPTKTLTEEEAKKEHEKVTHALQSE